MRIFLKKLYDKKRVWLTRCAFLWIASNKQASCTSFKNCMIKKLYDKKPSHPVNSRHHAKILNCMIRKESATHKLCLPVKIRQWASIVRNSLKELSKTKESATYRMRLPVKIRGWAGITYVSLKGLSIMKESATHKMCLPVNNRQWAGILRISRGGSKPIDLSRLSCIVRMNALCMCVCVCVSRCAILWLIGNGQASYASHVGEANQLTCPGYRASCAWKHYARVCVSVCVSRCAFLWIIGNGQASYASHVGEASDWLVQVIVHRAHVIIRSRVGADKLVGGQHISAQSVRCKVYLCENVLCLPLEIKGEWSRPACRGTAHFCTKREV